MSLQELSTRIVHLLGIDQRSDLDNQTQGIHPWKENLLHVPVDLVMATIKASQRSSFNFIITARLLHNNNHIRHLHIKYKLLRLTLCTVHCHYSTSLHIVGGLSK